MGRSGDNSHSNYCAYAVTSLGKWQKYLFGRNSGTIDGLVKCKHSSDTPIVFKYHIIFHLIRVSWSVWAAQNRMCAAWSRSQTTTIGMIASGFPLHSLLIENARWMSSRHRFAMIEIWYFLATNAEHTSRNFMNGSPLQIENWYI